MTDSEPIRLQKYLAETGICSRRDAEVLIREGEVWVNAVKAIPGQKVTPGVDRVTVSGKSIKNTKPQPKITLAMHKPRGLVCSNDDPFNPQTVFDLLPREFSKYRFFCAGRLDKESEGLLILTTDGELANRLMHPSNVVVKRYFVALKKAFPQSRIPQLVRGITVDGEHLKVETATLVNAGKSAESESMDVSMHHGKKREIRVLFGKLGYDVKRLRRYQIGSFPLKGIPMRAMKQLSLKEINSLFKDPGEHPHAVALAQRTVKKHVA
ncbi:MAG: pseudouridine synthase [Rariglobus sp.]